MYKVGVGLAIRAHWVNFIRLPPSLTTSLMMPLGFHQMPISCSSADSGGPPPLQGPRPSGLYLHSSMFQQEHQDHRQMPHPPQGSLLVLCCPFLDSHPAHCQPYIDVDSFQFLYGIIPSKRGKFLFTLLTSSSAWAIKP